MNGCATYSRERIDETKGVSAQEHTAPNKTIDQGFGSTIEIVVHNPFPVATVCIHLLIEEVDKSYRVSVHFLVKNT